MMAEGADRQPLAGEAAALLKALAHPARLVICCHIRDREASVGEIEAALNIHQPRLSRELAKLRAAGLVETRREATVIHYRLSDTGRTAAMIDAICAVMSGQNRDKNRSKKSSAHKSKLDSKLGVFARARSSL